MATGKDILIQINGDAKGFTGAARQAEQAAGRLPGAINPVNSAARSASSGIGVMNIALGNLAAQGITMAIQGLQALGSTMISYNAKMEQARVGFTSLLGSADAAGVFVQQLQDFAAKTPFEFPQVQDAAKRFLAFGFAANEVIPSLTAVGDAVAALGGSSEMIDRVTMALGQIKSKGRVQGEELLQLAEAGIPAYQILADKLKMTGAEVANIGDKGIDADTAIKALTEGMSERFGGMMEAQSKTFTGLMSNLKDNTTMVIGGLGEAAFNAAKGALEGVVALTSRISDSMRAGGLQQVFRDLVPADLQPKIATVANAFLNFGETVYNVGARIMTTWQEAMGKGGDTLVKWLPMIERVASALVTVLGTAVQLVVQWIGVFADVATEAAGFIVSAWDTLGQWFNAIAQSIAEALQWLQDSVIGPVAEAFGSSAETVAGIWEDLRNWIVTKTSGMVKGILEALGPLGKALGIAFSGLGDAWNSLAGGKSDTFGKWASSAKKSTTDVAKGLTDLANHKARTMEMGGDKASKAADKEAKEADKVSEAIEKAWTKQTETKLQLNDRWFSEMMTDLERTKSANENYERDKQRVAETYAARRSEILQAQAKEEREIRENTVKALADIDQKTAAGFLGRSTGADGKLAEINREYQAQVNAIDQITAKRKEANDKHLADYGTRIESEQQIEQDAATRKLAIEAKYLEDRRIYRESAQAVEDELKKARDANDVAAFAAKLTEENALKLAQQQEQQTMMDMLYKWQQEAHMSMTTFMLQQADQVKNSLAAGIAQSIVYSKNLGETLANIGKQVAAAFIEMMVKQALAAALGQSLQKMMMASTLASAAAVAAAWAPAAFLAAVATQGTALAFGGMAIAGAAGSAALLGGLTAGLSAAGGAPAGQPGAMPMASGGIVTGPTYALIGEGRYEEAVIPLEKDKLAALGLGGGSGAQIVQNNYGDIHRDVDYERIQMGFGELVASALRG